MEPNAALLALLITASVLSKGAATGKASDAYLRYTGTDTYISDYAKQWQNQIPKDAQVYLGGAFYVGNALSERKITITWTFP